MGQTNFSRRALRPVVREIQPRQGDYIFIYQSTPTFGALIDVARQLKRPAIVYGYRNENAVEGNLTFKPFDPRTILEDLAGSAYAVANAGHNLICEALYFGKPLLCFPVGVNFEQVINAWHVRELGYGDFSASFHPTLAMFANFESRMYRRIPKENSGKFRGRHGDRHESSSRSYRQSSGAGERMSAPIKVAYIFERYPVLSQTFLRREVAGVCGHGVHVEIHSMLAPRAADRVHALADVPVDYFHWWEAGKLVVALPRELLRDRALLRDGWRLYRRYRPTNSENFWTTVWATIFAVCRARRVRQDKPDVVHGVWATGPATAAAILGRLCGIPFTFGAHAHDIYRHGGDAFLEPKLRAAHFIHTTTQAGVTYLRERANGASVKIILARRGLDRLPPKSSTILPRDRLGCSPSVVSYPRKPTNTNSPPAPRCNHRACRLP